MHVLNGQRGHGSSKISFNVPHTRRYLTEFELALLSTVHTSSTYEAVLSYAENSSRNRVVASRCAWKMFQVSTVYRTHLFCLCMSVLSHQTYPQFLGIVDTAAYDQSDNTWRDFKSLCAITSSKRISLLCLSRTKENR